MIYLVVENSGDYETQSSNIIYATENLSIAENKRFQSESNHRSQIAKMNSVFKKLNKKDFEDFTEDEMTLYREALDIQYNEWYSTNIKEIDIDTNISVYI